MTHPTPNLTGTVFEGHFVAGPYERIFFEPGQEGRYIRNYIDHLNGEVEYDFRIEEYFNLRVVGLQSTLGDASIVVISEENRKKLPEFIQETRILYVVDSIEAVYRAAEAMGVPILQPRTENIMGAQGRLELAPGYIVELAETSNRSLFHPDIESLDLPPSEKASGSTSQ